jgi:hypothetical protein
MNWLLLLYNLLIAAMILDAAASFLASWYIHSLRHRFGWYISFAFLGVAVQAVVQAMTMGLAPSPGRLVASIMAINILARLLKTVSMVLLTLFLLGYVNGKHK